MSPVPIDTSDLTAGDVIEIQSDVLGAYRATFVEHSRESAGAIWVETKEQLMLIGADGRLMISSRRTPYRWPPNR